MSATNLSDVMDSFLRLNDKAFTLKGVELKYEAPPVLNDVIVGSSSLRFAVRRGRGGDNEHVIVVKLEGEGGGMRLKCWRDHHDGSHRVIFAMPMQALASPVDIAMMVATLLGAKHV